MATCSGAILGPKALRSWSTDRIGSAFSRSQRVMTKRAALPSAPPQPDGRLGAGRHRIGGVHHHEGRIGGQEALHDLAHEVGVARRVEEGDPMAVVLQHAHRERERQLALLLLGLEVQGGRGVLDPAQPVEGAGGVEQVFGQRRLAGAGVTGQHDVAQVIGGDGLHERPLLGERGTAWWATEGTARDPGAAPGRVWP